MIEIKDLKKTQIKRDCNKCVFSSRDGNCTKWSCEGTKTIDDIRTDERKNVLVDIKARFEGGNCDECEYEHNDCYKECDKEGWEIENFKKWLERKINELQ